MFKVGATLILSTYLSICGNSAYAQVSDNGSSSTAPLRNTVAPTPPQVGLPPSGQQDLPKVPLSWRLIAYGMAADKTASKKIKDQWTLPIPFERSYKTLNATLTQL